MELVCEIICNNFEQKKRNDNRIYCVEQSEEYYIVPLNKSYDVEYDDDIFKLKFKNQLLFLKYSNRFGEIFLKEYELGYDDYLLIKSDNILDIYVKIISNNYFRRNVWQTNTVVYMNKKYSGDYFLILPIIEDMISIKEFGEGVPIINVEMITNEILLRKVKPSNNHAYLGITYNFLLNKDALFIRVSGDELDKFF